jgi:hypothetical protein
MCSFRGEAGTWKTGSLYIFRTLSAVMVGGIIKKNISVFGERKRHTQKKKHGGCVYPSCSAKSGSEKEGREREGMFMYGIVLWDKQMYVCM